MRLFNYVVVACIFSVSSFADPSYSAQTYAGSPVIGDNIAAVSAILQQAEGVARDRAGNLYIADAAANRVRKITTDGIIHTLAGTGLSGYTGDGGPAAQAQLSQPYGVALDAFGNVFIADLGNACVRRVAASDGVITTAVSGLNAPRNLAFDTNGGLLISDFGANQVLRMASNGSTSLVAGTGKAGSSGDNGSPLLATLKSPAGLAVDAAGAIYVADSGNNRIRKIQNSTISSVFSVAGPTGLAYSGNSLYIAASNYFGSLTAPVGNIIGARDVTLDSSGNIYVLTHTQLMQVSGKGSSTVLAGSAANASFSY